MRNFMGMLGVSLLFFSAAAAFSQSSPGESAITAEEYEIYRLVVEALEGRSTVDKETLPDAWPPADALLRTDGISPDPDIIKDFNEKNLRKHRLSDAFLEAMAQGSEGTRAGRKKASFSRVGFDGEKRRALLLMGITLYYPEDIMNEGKYVFLKKQNEKWTIENTAGAWAVRLGPIR